MRCCTPRSLLRDRLPLPSARRRRRVPMLRVHRLHPQQLGSRYPARLAASGIDDEADRGTQRKHRRFTIAHRPGVNGHPRRDSGCAGTGSGLGGTSGKAHFIAGGRDAGRASRRSRPCRRPRVGVAAGHKRHRRRRHRPVPTARRRRGRAGSAQLAGRDRLPGGHQLAHAAGTRQRVAGGVVEPARAPGRRPRR